MIRRSLGAAFLPLAFATLLHAAPMLRLVNTTVVPVPVATGVNVGNRVVEAYNAGDGSLSVSVVASVAWISPSVGSQRDCSTTTAAAACIPLQFALNTSALTAGTYTGTVTVSAPNAVDAPQTITVTVRIGGVDVYVAPGSSRDVPFSTSSPLTGIATTQDGGRWLSLAVDGFASFRFTYPYKIHVAPQAGMAPGTYTGSLGTSGSSFVLDNQTIPVTMRVTTQPIAQASPDNVVARLAQGASPLPMQISLVNLGQGSLPIGAVSATTTDGGKWLTASANSGGWAAITLDAGTMAPGFYTGAVSIGSNAANGTISVPVNFQVVAKSAPLVNYLGVVDNAIFGSGDPIARGDIVDVFGEQFLFANITYSPGVPLATQLSASNSRVLVNGVAAPLYFSSYYQIAFQVPLETALGTALVQVQRDGLTSNTVTVQVADRAPRILVVVKPDLSVVDSTHPARVGDTLVIYCIGLGPTSPVVATGAPAPRDPLAIVTNAPMVSFGGGFIGSLLATPAFYGMSPDSVGLYQVNVTIPPGVPTGIVNLSVVFTDSASNIVPIAIQ